MQYIFNKVLPALIIFIGIGSWMQVNAIEPVINSSQNDSTSSQSAQSILIASNSPKLRLKRALHFEKSGLEKDAITDYLWLIENFPNQPEAYNNLARIYARNGEIEHAVALLESGLDTHATYRKITQNLATIYSSLASRAYQKALIEPENKAAVKAFSENPGLELSAVEPATKPVFDSERVAPSSVLPASEDSTLPLVENNNNSHDDIPVTATKVVSEQTVATESVVSETNTSNVPLTVSSDNINSRETPPPLDPNI